MNAKEFAKLITGREYREEMTPEEEVIAKESNLIVIFGASDDLVEFSGLFSDEVEAYDERDNILFNLTGIIQKPDQDDLDEDDFEIQFAKYFEDKKNAYSVDAIWCPEDENNDVYTSWEMRTKTEHGTFDIVEDGELYCKGIVIESA